MPPIAITRLAEERKAFKKNHSFGFVAKPSKNTDGTFNMMVWDCRIPGKSGTDWEGGSYQIRMTFPADYPMKPPTGTSPHSAISAKASLIQLTVAFTPPLFHPNVHTSGKICLSILSQHWKAEFSINQLLTGIQWLLDEANIYDPAQHAAYKLYSEAYDARVRAQALARKPNYG